MKHYASVLLLSALMFFGGCARPEKPLTLHIMHINDVHSHLDEEPLDLTLAGAKTRVEAGGFARITTEAKAFKKQYGNVLLLHAGDELQGTLYYTLFGGDADAAVMNTVPWDAFELGNHEFDDGDAHLARFLRQLKAPVLAANVLATGDDPLVGVWKPYVIKDFGGDTVGIIGIDNAHAAAFSSRPGKAIRFFGERETVQHYVDELRSKGIEKIVLLSHFGFENDLNLSRYVSGVDVIIDGHTHTLMGDYADLGLTPEAPYPVHSVSADGEPVCIAQAWSYAKIVGRLTVTFDSRGIVTSCGGTPLLMVDGNFTRKSADGIYREVNASVRKRILAQIGADPDIAVVAPDADTQRLLSKYKSEVDAKKKQIIGRAAKTLRHVRVPGRDYLGHAGRALPLGSEIAPVVAKAFYTRIETADACILNAGAVRTDLDAGPISINTVYTMLPFSDTLFTLLLSGGEIRSVLENALNNCMGKESCGAFPYAYGLRYGVDMGAPEGQRIEGLQIMNRQTGTWSAIDDKQNYTVVTLDYLAEGHDGYGILKQVQAERGKGTDTYLDYALTFADYVKGLNAKGTQVAVLPQNERCISSFRK